MYVTATEFKANFGKYAEIAQKQEFYVMKRGKELFRVVPPTPVDIDAVIDAMHGAIPLNDETRDITAAEIRAQRRARYERTD